MDSRACVTDNSMDAVVNPEFDLGDESELHAVAPSNPLAAACTSMACVDLCM